MPETVRQQTGGLGWQRFFAPDPRIRNGVKLLPGLDTRAAGGYVAAPPSVHPSGRRYRWIVPPGEAELAQAPEWLVALLEPVELPEPAPPPRPARTGDLSRYAAAAVDKAGERVAAAPSGSSATRSSTRRSGSAGWSGAACCPAPRPGPGWSRPGCGCARPPGRDKRGKPYKPWTRREVEWRVDRALAAGEAKPRTPEARP
jgi:hypothetical protein